MFKYPKLVFEQGTFVWGISRSTWLAIIVVGVALRLFLDLVIPPGDIFSLGGE